MSSGRDEPPINALPFTFLKMPMPTISIPAPAVVTPAPQPPMIALVPPTPEGPQMDKPVSERVLPDFPSTSQTSAHTGVTPPQSDSNSAFKPEPKPVLHAVDKPVAASKSGMEPTASEPLVSHTPTTTPRCTATVVHLVSNPCQLSPPPRKLPPQMARS